MKNKIKGLSLVALTTILPMFITFADEITDTIDSVINWLTTVGGGLAVLFIVIAGVMMITSNENADNVKKAGQIIKWAGIGLAIILLARAITGIVKGFV